ncbi:MAG: NUDIX hydrolase [Actinobacteria bacterium]|nr:NUDIX hydrolase [Actinomycetota bacterium]
MIDSLTGWYVVPATIKAVVLSKDGQVLLARNRRQEWELPGGWPTEADRSAADVIRREVAEEASIEVEVGPLLHAELSEVGGHQVVIVIYACRCTGHDSLRASGEHEVMAWVSRDELGAFDLIPAYATAVGFAFDRDDLHLAGRTIE